MTRARSHSSRCARSKAQRPGPCFVLACMDCVTLQVMNGIYELIKSWSILERMLAFVLLAPLAGGLLAGIDRRVSARLQGRYGPPVLQPFYDVFKLLRKERIIVNKFQDFHHRPLPAVHHVFRRPLLRRRRPPAVDLQPGPGRDILRPRRILCQLSLQSPGGRAGDHPDGRL